MNEEEKAIEKAKAVALGERLRIALDIRGMSQADLAKLTNIDRQKISAYCQGRYRPKLEPLKSMARALEVNSMWLYGEEGAEMDEAITKEVIRRTQCKDLIDRMDENNLDKAYLILKALM